MDEVTAPEKKKKPPVILLTVLGAIILAVIVALFLAPKGSEKLVTEKITAPPVSSDATIETGEKITEEASVEEIPVQEESTPQDAVIEEEKVETEEIKEQEEIKAVKDTEEVQEREEAQKAQFKEYKIEQGDTLWTIAGKDEVLDDPEGWWYLLKSNKKIIKSTYKKDGKWYVIIPTGHTLVIPTRDEIKKINKDEKKSLLHPWAVQVYSSKSQQNVKDFLNKIHKQGYLAYMTHIKLNNEDWYRLRIGFFSTEDEARKVGEKVVTDFNMEGFWTVLPSKGEVNAHIGPGQSS